MNLLDVNGMWGKGGYGRPDFPTMQSVLENMDYLQIDRRIVCHRDAVDVDATLGNRRLLAEIDASPAACDRLIPALVITPAAWYQHGAMQHLRDVLEAGRTRALRIFPKSSRFPISHIERVLGELAGYKPTVLCDIQHECAGQSDVRDLIELAGKFPELNFVLTESMWREFSDVLDMMWRRANIHTDTSWLHMRETLELLVEEFGPGRVLFGTGFRSHYGSAIVELNRAQIPDDARRRIAHGNAERMLALAPPSRPAATGDSSDKPLWQRFRRGEALDDVAIIDAHSHTGPHALGWFVKDIDEGEYIVALERQMDRLGVDRMLIVSQRPLFGDPVEGSKMAEAAFQGHPRFRGYLPFNPHYVDELTEQLDNLFASGFHVGFKVLPAYWGIGVTDPRYEAMWAYADRLAMPILLHTWDDSYNSPAMLTEIVRRYPDATFILGHSGGGDRGRAEAEELAVANENVLMEFCGSFCSHRLWEDTFARVGYEKVVFGSDTGAHSQGYELGHLLSIPVPDEKLLPVLSANIERALKKSKAPGGSG